MSRYLCLLWYLGEDKCLTSITYGLCRRERCQGYCTGVPRPFLSHSSAPIKEYPLFLSYFLLEALEAMPNIQAFKRP